MSARDSLRVFASALRTPEQMEWIHDRFKIDGLERLARSTPDYYEQKGYYLPDVAALAHAAIREEERATERLMTALVAFYNADYQECARVCDEVLDPSGGLLGQVREEARREHG